MRARWKAVGLGMLTMLVALLAISGLQILYRKYLPADPGPLAVAGTFLVAYLPGARWNRAPPRWRTLPQPRKWPAGLAIGIVLYSATMAAFLCLLVAVYLPYHAVQEGRIEPPPAWTHRNSIKIGAVPRHINQLRPVLRS